ncbi:hypothetical protein DPMN_097162 [Dreissena polymorpha]|uniref:Uncharacterized protein n=1 Tax=Dreissena polymorpha TaxID=45954 RepID=A0A9D4L9T0_DREPO|nr:hypothetical protein DPMN_097162 [Dreissena polymorpha]
MCATVAAKQDESLFSKWGPGGVNRPTRYSYCPVHYAVMYSHVVSTAQCTMQSCTVMW